MAKTFGSSRSRSAVRGQVVVDDRVGGRFARARGGVERARWTRARSAFAVASSFASAAKVRFSFVRFLVAPTARLRFSEWSAPSTRTCRRRRSRSTAKPAAQRSSRSKAASSRRQAANCRAGQAVDCRPAVGSVASDRASRPGAVAPVFSRRLWQPRHARQGRAGTPRRNPVRFRKPRIGIAVAIGMPGRRHSWPSRPPR